MENKRRNRRKKVVKFDKKRLQKFLKNATEFTSNIDNFQYTEMDSPTLMDKLDYVNITFKKLEIERKKLHKLLVDEDFEAMKGTNNGFTNLKWIHQDATKRISQASFRLSKHKKEEDFWNKTLEASWLDKSNKSKDDDLIDTSETVEESRSKIIHSLDCECDPNEDSSEFNLSDTSKELCEQKQEATSCNPDQKSQVNQGELCTEPPRVFEFKPLKEGPQPEDKLFIIPSIYAPDELRRRERREEENARRMDLQSRPGPGTSRDYLILDGMRKMWGPERQEFNTKLYEGLYSDSD